LNPSQIGPYNTLSQNKLRENDHRFLVKGHCYLVSVGGFKGSTLNSYGGAGFCERGGIPGRRGGMGVREVGGRGKLVRSRRFDGGSLTLGGRKKGSANMGVLLC